MQHDRIIRRLQESPRRIGEVDFDMANIEFNKNLLSKLKSDSRLEVIGHHNNLPIQKSGNQIFLEVDGEIVYWVKFEDSDYRMVDSAVQVAVWRAKGSGEYASGLPAKIFFDYLLRRHGVIVTDSAQSLKGENFWQDRMVEALKRGLHVFYLDLRQRVYKRMQSLADIEKYSLRAYGEDRKHGALRFAIATSPDLIHGTEIKESRTYYEN